MPHPTMSNGSTYREGNSMDRSSGSMSHRRYSSTDSMEGSINSGHSRQGSDSNDASYPTRRMSTQMLRRQSTGGDPLQFIKGKPSTELAQLAETQIKVAAESKKVAITTASMLDEDDPTDWQANLSTWKNRRKSQSERSYQMKEELEKMEREKDGGERSAPVATKTYSQMAEERERRKSTGRHFYPIHDDEEEDDIFSTPKSSDNKTSSDDVFTVSHKPRAEIAPWARDEVGEGKKDIKDVKDEEEGDESSESEDEEINNNKENENSLNKDKNYSSPSSMYKSPSYHSKGPDNDFVQKESVSRTYAAPQQQTVRPSGNNSSSQDMINRGESFKSVGPRTQSKIGSIMNKFQESQASAAAPKQGYNERIDLKSRMKSFQSSSADKDTSSNNQNGPQRRVNLVSSNFNNYRNSFDQTEESFSAPVSHSVPERSKSASSDSKRDADRQKQVEKIIKIRQKPNDDKGFGFIFTGGTDQDKPLTVSKVALGSGADVCELRVKDEIVSINQCDVTDKTSMEVGDMVAKAVGKGFIELRVHRERSSDDFSDEEDEMTSSSDEGEEDLNQQNAKNVITPTSQRQQYSQPESEARDSEPVAEITEEIQAVHVDRNQSAPQMFNSQPVTVQAKADEDEEEEDEEDGGPPAILRKWQRQRQRNEYAFENSPSLDSSDSPVYKKISLNAPIPKVDNSMNDDTNFRITKPWDHMQEEWNKQQEQQRMPDERISQHDITDNKAHFDARQKEIERQYEESLKIAEQIAEEKRKQEQEFLQPEIDKARILEERRMQRRNRIQETVAATTAPPTQLPAHSTPPSSSVYESPILSSSTASSFQQAAPPAAFHHDKDPEPSTVSHVTSMTLNIEAKDNNNKYNITPASFNIPRMPGNDVIIIDPRNRSSSAQEGTPLEFQVKLAPKANEESSMRTAQEEIERQRLQQIEEEKMKLIQDKERKLQEQEELLRQERERFRREQEEFRERQQQLQQQQQAIQQQQQKQHSYPPPPPPPQEQEYIQRSQQQSNFSSPYSTSSNPQYNKVQSSLQPSPSSSPYVNSLSVSPVQFPSSATSSPSLSPYTTNTSNNHGPTSSKPTWPPATSQRSPQQQPREIGNSYNSPRTYKTSNNPTFASVQPQFNTTITTSNPNTTASVTHHVNDHGRRDRFDGPKGGKFSREDILAMNKKPFQESVASRVSQVENQSRGSNRSPNRMPIAREPPIRSQNQAHPLNSAPKAKLRDDSEWKDPSRYQRQDQRSPSGRDTSSSPRRPGYGSSQEHWLIQEAERRRVSGHAGRAPPSQSGPIKPLPDISNRWRDNNSSSSNNTYQPENPNNNNNPESMPNAIRQTLLQKTAGARGSDDGYMDGDLIPPPQQQLSLQQQIPNRSVSPRRGGDNYYHQAHSDLPARKPQTSYSPNDLSNKYNINPIHQIQQPPPPTLNRVPPQPHGYNPGPGQHPPGRENGLPVNGSQLCSHCNDELGFGAAMVIESLGIFFHLQCFRCCVCHASLGTGAQGADVRVRMNKLHCQNCYSNDEGRYYQQQNFRSRKIWIEV